jgi:O-antigen ligase
VPRREQLHALGIAVAAAVLAALAAAPFRGLTSLGASLSTRETQGAVVLVLLVVIMLAAAVIQVRIAGRPTAPLKLPRRAPWIVLGVICAGLALAIVLGAKETSKLPSGTSAARYTTLQSDRYEYWRVALDAFVDHPINGVGAGGWAVRWLQFRKLQGYAVDAHSLELQTLAELGIVGLALLALLLGGVGLAVRSALTRAGPRVAGPVAGLVVWLAHSPLDWDWQLPALTLVAAVLAGTLLAATEELGMAASRETGERITDPDADPESPARPLTAGNRLAVPR